MELGRDTPGGSPMRGTSSADSVRNYSANTTGIRYLVIYPDDLDLDLTQPERHGIERSQGSRLTKRGVGANEKRTNSSVAQVPRCVLYKEAGPGGLQREPAGVR